MSYILDALRRAEADREREHGRVAGLHTPPAPGSAPVPAAGARRWLPWAGAALLLLAGVGAGSWWAGGPRETVSPAAAPLPAPEATPARRPEAALSAAAPPSSAAVATPPAAPPSSPFLPPAPPPEAVHTTPTPVLEAPVPRLAELPQSTRSALPKLAISGTVYSDDPASSFVIINGEVQREGARLAPDLVLEQIRPRELLLRFRGQRYRQPV